MFFRNKRNVIFQRIKGFRGELMNGTVATRNNRPI